jgi:Type IV pilin-like G and H, putative
MQKLKSYNSTSLLSTLLLAFTVFLNCLVSGCEDPSKVDPKKLDLNKIYWMNKLQIDRKIENKTEFTSDIEDLGSCLKCSERYVYSARIYRNNLVQNLAIPKKDGLTTYMGIVYYYKDKNNMQKIKSIVCESEKRIEIAAVNMIKTTTDSSSLSCPSGYTENNRFKKD